MIPTMQAAPKAIVAQNRSSYVGLKPSAAASRPMFGASMVNSKVQIANQ